METPLTALQQAYLQGRSNRWPLGGVAMHDFREYRALHLDMSRLEVRLAELVRHYPALRTCINVQAGTQYVRSEATVHLDCHALRFLDDTEAQLQVEQLRERYSHQIHDPAQPLWRIVVLHLSEQEDPPGEPYDTLIFTSFDALILDGSGISTTIARLFDGRPLTTSVVMRTLPTIPVSQRKADADWWRDKLKDVTTPSMLPWRVPLATIASSRYRRASLTVSRDTLKQLCRLGSPQLLRNSLLSTLILDTLVHWTTDGELCVGVPVAFPAEDGSLGNTSSFVAIRYPRVRGDFIQRAQALQEDVLGALDHLAFSSVDLARQLLKQSQAGPSLPVILTNCLGWETLSTDASVRFHNGLTQTPQVAIDIRLTLDSERNLQLCVDYAEQALCREQVESILTALQRRIELSCQRVDLAIAPADFIDLAHYRYNESEANYVPSPWLAQLAGRLFDTKNSSTALICGEQNLTYGELGQRVSMAIASLQERDLQSGNVVALYLPRSPEQVILSLACALLGIIWVPLDINSPPERASWLLNNCRPDLVVDAGELNSPSGIRPETLLLPTNREPVIPNEQTLMQRSVSEAASYYLYTSGTTGNPKCVVLNNRATGNVIQQTLQRWTVTADDVFISVTPPHHDMSMFDLFGSLCAGSRLVLPASHQEKDAISWN